MQKAYLAVLADGSIVHPLDLLREVYGPRHPQRRQVREVIRRLIPRISELVEIECTHGEGYRMKVR